MPENMKKSDELDELSRLLDEMNSGRQPECSDDDIAKLLEVASILKDTEINIRPPQHILDQTVDRAMAGVQAGRAKRSRAWFYSGALGTAAAVMLIFGLSLLPSWSRQLPSNLPPAVNSDFQNTTQDTTKQPPLAFQSDPAGEQEKVTATIKKDAPVQVEQQLPREAPIAPTVVPAAPPIERPSSATTVKRSPILAEQDSMVNKSSSSYKASSVTTAIPKILPPGITALSLPGRTPDTILPDTVNGSLRQVFNKGTPEEIIITQRVHVETTQSKSLTTTMTESEEKPAGINQVTVTIFGQDVTIEGRQSQQELLHLVEALTP